MTTGTTKLIKALTSEAAATKVWPDRTMPEIEARLKKLLKQTRQLNLPKEKEVKPPIVSTKEKEVKPPIPVWGRVEFEEFEEKQARSKLSDFDFEEQLLPGQQFRELFPTQIKESGFLFDNIQWDETTGFAKNFNIKTPEGESFTAFEEFEEKQARSKLSDFDFEEQLLPDQQFREERFPTQIEESGFLFVNIQWDKKTGSPIDFNVITPEGESFTYEEFLEKQTEGDDYALLYKAYLKGGGERDFQDWLSMGAPLWGEAAEAERRVNLEEAASSVWPDMTTSGVIELFNSSQGAFLAKVKSGGPTEDKKNLLMQIGYTNEDINTIFNNKPTYEEWLEIKGVQAYAAPKLTPEQKEWVDVPGDYPALVDVPGEDPTLYTPEEAWEKTLYSLYLYENDLGWYGETIAGGMTKALATDTAMLGDAAAVFSRVLVELPRQWQASFVQLLQGMEGAREEGWGTKTVEKAQENQEKFIRDTIEKYPNTPWLVDLAMMAQNIAYSTTTMVVGVAAGAPISLAPIPGARYWAYGVGTAASGYTAYRMTTYQIMKTYLDFKNEEMFETEKRHLTQKERNALYEDFKSKAHEYGLWEAVPEALSNLAFALILKAPLIKMGLGKGVAEHIVVKLAGIFGEEFLTETITQKGQRGIEVSVGLAEKEITYLEALKEIAPQTFLLTVILGGLGVSTSEAYSKVKNQLKKENPGETLDKKGFYGNYEPLKGFKGPEIFEGVTPTTEAVPEAPTTEGVTPTPTAEAPTTEGVTPTPTAEVVSPEREIVTEGGVPVSPDAPISQEVVKILPIVQDMGVITRWLRPTRHVFRVMGFHEVYKGIQKAEVEIGEARRAFNEKLKELSKLVDMKRRPIIFRELENPGSQTGLTYDEKRAVTFFKKNFDKWADALNIPMEKRVKNYVTHLFEADIAKQLEADHPLDPAIARVLEYVTPKTILNPFLKKRLGKTVGLIEDPFAAASAYESRQLKVFYYEPMLQKIAAIANASSTPTAARDYLKDFSRRMTGEPSKLDLQINTTLQGFAKKVEKLPGGSALSSLLSQGNPSGMAAYQFTSVLYTLWLGFKPTSAIRNLSQHALIIAEVGPLHFADGIRLRITNEGKEALTHSKVWSSRRDAVVPGIDDSFTSRWTDKFREAALFMFRKADEQNVKDAFLAGYSESKSLLPDADRQVWFNRGDEVAADTQYLYTKMNSMALSQNSLGRVFSMLTTWSINWMELMTKWVSKRPSQVYLQQEKLTGKKISGANWSTSYKSILMYMAIIGLGYALKERERIKAWEYTGITSIKYLADVIGGDFPGLQAPGAVADMVAGFILGDERRLKAGWSEAKSTFTPAIAKQIEDVASGEKDWLTVVLYLEGKDFHIKQLVNKWEKGWEKYESFELPEDTSSMTKEEIAKLGRIASTDRNKYRKANPLIEAQMFVASKFTTLSSDEARAEVLRIIEKNELDTELIEGYEKVFGVDTKKKFSKAKELLGTVELDDYGEQKLRENGELDYYTTSNFASDVNEQEKIVGRTKIEKDGNPEAVPEAPTLAIEYLRAKDSFVQYDNFTTDETRTLFRQQHPDVEAQLYLWGRISSFKNPNSATELLRLMEKYKIHPESIPAFLEKPERHEELSTLKFEIQQRSFELVAEYEGFGLETSPNHIKIDDTIRVDGEEVNRRKYERAQFKKDHPDWWADQKRIEAIDNDVPDKLDGMNGIDAWAERGTIVNEYGANSPQDKVWFLDHPETYKWAIEKLSRKDTMSGWNEPVLRINAQYFEQDETYDNIDPDDVNPKTRRSLRLEYLEENEEYRKARRTRDANKWDGADEVIISSHVEYGEKFLDNDTDSSSEAKLWRYNNKKYDEFRTNIPDGDSGHLEELDLENLPVWQIDVKWRDKDAEYDAIAPDTINEATGVLHRTEWLQMLENEEYRKARRARQAYELSNSLTGYELPHSMVKEYVDYSEHGIKGMRQERFLVDNPNFAKALYDAGQIADIPLAEDVPAVQYDDIYDQYQDLFLELEGLSSQESIYFEEDPDARDTRRNAMRFDEDGIPTPFGIAELARNAYGEFVPEEHIENYITYYTLAEKGYRRKRLLKDNPEFAQVMKDIKGIDLPPDGTVPEVQYDNIYDQYQDLFLELEGLGAHKSNYYVEDPDARDTRRNAIRFDEDGQYTQFGIAELARNAYGEFVPEEHIENYIGYYIVIGEGKPDDYEKQTETDLWYEDDWYLMEHMDFYQDIYKGLLGNEKKNFIKVPTRAVFRKYLTYVKLPHAKARQDYRLANPDLDAWGAIKFGWKPIEEQDIRTDLTPYEKLQEEWSPLYERLRKKVAALK